MANDAIQLMEPEETIGLIIDTQEKLHRVINNAHRVMRKVALLSQGLCGLGVPLLITEQYPQGVGPTEPMIKEAAGNAPVIEKREFSCYRNRSFIEAMEPHGAKSLLVCGFETHVCVLQTSLQALERGHRVYVVGDAVGSRTDEDHELALGRMRDAGCVIVSAEMALFELLQTSESPHFKSIHKLMK